MKAKTSEQVLTEARRLLPIFYHEFKKPEATIRMFVDILPQIKDHPSEILRWKSIILTSFDATFKLLDELQHVLALPSE